MLRWLDHRAITSWHFGGPLYAKFDYMRRAEAEGHSGRRNACRQLGEERNGIVEEALT